jgi:hypothetical protein
MQCLHVLRAFVAALVACFITILFYAEAADSPAPVWILTRDTSSFDRHFVTDRKAVERIHSSGTLAGAVGWFDYDFAIPATGWYEIVVNGNGHDVEFFIDPQRARPDGVYIPGSRGFDGKTDKLGNFRLEKGMHTLRVQRHYWTGFPAITDFAVRAADGSPARTVRVAPADTRSVFRRGECGKLEIRHGPHAQPVSLPIHWVNAITLRTLKSYVVTLPAVRSVSVQHWPMPCDTEGRFVLYFNDGGKTIANRDVHPVEYEVIDSTPRKYSPKEPLKKTLVQTIDCVIEPPAYSTGATRITRKSFGAYRESDDAGWLDRTRSRLPLHDPSWFAYELKGLQPQQPHLVEIDYPDDARRTFAIALRESQPLSYPVAGGVDSGGEFALSQAMQTHSLLYWPRAEGTRIVFLPARSGDRAAAARIRVYRLDGDLPPLAAPRENGRRFVNWYEEGSNFLSMYGAPDNGPNGVGIALDRWAKAAVYMGFDTLAPTAVIYSFALYPSRYHVAFSRPWMPDTLRRLLLTAEKHGLRVLPELHPRADELSWLFPDAPEPKPNLLVSKDGGTRKDLPPFFSPLHPANQEWYLGAVGELADNYKDSPALLGVSLRMMQWKNPALHNFHSLDWGYDDYTIALFEKETGIKVAPARTDSSRFSARYHWLMAHARVQWIEWRCRKIADLVVRIRDRVRAARKDLEVHIPVFPMTESGSTYNNGREWLREAGIDPALLSKIDGVVLVNALHAYGRRFGGEIDQMLRTNLTNPDIQRVLSPAGTVTRFLPYAMYFEATEAVVPPEKLGFPANTKKTWMSAVINPAARNYLERYALLLASADAVLLGDGGNAYTLGQPELQEFLKEYRQLPAAPFRARADARDPVAVWERQQETGYLFYAVNRTPRPAELRLVFEGTGPVSRLSSGDAVPVENGILHIRLKPFQLIAYGAPASVRISKAEGR